MSVGTVGSGKKSWSVGEPLGEGAGVVQAVGSEKLAEVPDQT